MIKILTIGRNGRAKPLVISYFMKVKKRKASHTVTQSQVTRHSAHQPYVSAIFVCLANVTKMQRQEIKRILHQFSVRIGPLR